MAGCAVMAPARERPPTFITPPPALSLCNQNNLGARKSEPGEVATMSPRTHYWIIHWLRVVLWPLPVMTLFQGLAVTLAWARHGRTRLS